MGSASAEHQVERFVLELLSTGPERAYG